MTIEGEMRDLAARLTAPGAKPFDREEFQRIYLESIERSLAGLTDQERAAALQHWSERVQVHGLMGSGE